MNRNKVGFTSQCHPEPQPLPLGCALKSSCSGSHQTMDSGSRCLDNKSGEMPNQVWHDTSFGFTLIELLVVVLIIGILASVALPQYNKAVERSRMAEAMQRLGDYASAQQVYYMHNNGFASAYSTLNQGDIKVPEQTEVGNWDTSDSRWSVASASGSSLEKVTMSALRTGGIFKDCVLTLSVEANGKITKTCSGNTDCCTAAKNGGYEETETSGDSGNGGESVDSELPQHTVGGGTYFTADYCSHSPFGGCDIYTYSDGTVVEIAGDFGSAVVHVTDKNGNVIEHQTYSSGGTCFMNSVCFSDFCQKYPTIETVADYTCAAS